MSTTSSAPATYSRPSRKGKKAWRKNVDITDVQDGLENLRDEVIAGGVIAEKPTEQLFTTDVTGDNDVTQKQRKQKLLTADQIIAQRSLVPGLDGRKRKLEDVAPSTGKRQKNGKYVSHRELQRLRGVADNVGGALRFHDDGAARDLWGEAPPAIDPALDFLEPPKARTEPKTMRHAPAPKTVSGKPLAHVRKPDAGKSYNPLVGDWSALFEREAAAAVESEKASLALQAERDAAEARAEAEAARVEAAEKDEFATDYESGWESEWDGFQSETEQPTTYAQKLQRRKTPSERNKIIARKERERHETWERKQKERVAQEARIKQIAKEVSARDRARRPGQTPAVVRTGDVSSDSDENDGSVKLRRSRFGKLSIPDAPLELTLPDELQDTLRRLKPEGNLLTDRYRNLLINGKLEVRKKVGQVKKKQTFRTEKWTYKDFKV